MCRAPGFALVCTQGLRLCRRSCRRPPRQPGRVFEASTFERLLDFLGGTDATSKAEKYRQVRDRLESFFRWRGLGDASGLADDTLDRVARRVEAGEVRTSTPNAFVVGVARMVAALEAGRKDRKDVNIGGSQHRGAGAC